MHHYATHICGIGTAGLDGLEERCAKFYAMGARFAKWRNVLTITDTNPTERAIQDCVHTLAKSPGRRALAPW